MFFSIDVQRETSTFLYKENVLDDHTFSKIKYWVENQDYLNGYCISGKEIPRQQLWYHDNLLILRFLLHFLCFLNLLPTLLQT